MIYILLVNVHSIDLHMISILRLILSLEHSIIWIFPLDVWIDLHMITFGFQVMCSYRQKKKNYLQEQQ